MTDRGQLEIGFAAPQARKSGRLRHHHVRAHATVQDALAGEARAASQEEIVLAWYRARSGQRFTPWECSEALGLFIVSARRAITNLCDAGFLLHFPGDRPSGPYGQRCGTWGIE